jgi:mono/diheme cytochrome c family protein
MQKFTFLVFALLLICSGPSRAVDFEKEIRPLLQKHCVECHGAKKQKGELRLDAKAFAFKGGAEGEVLKPGKAFESVLYKRVISTDEQERMPPEGDRLSAAEVSKIREWIEGGAQWIETEKDRAASIDPRLQHWAFQPLRPHSSHSNLDAFVEEKLKANGLAFSPEADRRILARRAYLDVTGLPPSPEEIAAFASDNDPKAYEKLVERLLASPRFGERWARHWLDVARFAESHGFEMNQNRKNAWPYRDYVIRAFNADLPYNQFMREQIAGDADGVDAATGFLVGGPMDQVKSKDPVLTANQRADELHDMVSTTCAVFLGLTVNCARCHDHKFDPIPTADYYALTAILQGVKHGERPLRSAVSESSQARLKVLREELKPIEQRLSAFRNIATRARVLIVDESTPPANASKAGAMEIQKPANTNPIYYSPGREKGQAEDLGDTSRLPNIGESYKFWNSEVEKPSDLMVWQPRASGDFRIWISWGAWTTHTTDAHYILDVDGDLTTHEDQVELASVNQRTFADGSPAVPAQKRWSGFKAAQGRHRFTENSVIVLRSGKSGGPVAADVLALEQVSGVEKIASVPRVRVPVQGSENEDVFNPLDARFLRFTITTASARESQPCLDELEVFTDEASPRNVALSKTGAKVTVSGTYADGGNPKHQAMHLIDGKYGNDFSWISNEANKGWVQIEFAKTERISRVLWSRDRSKIKQPFKDRLATGYKIEVSVDAEHWTVVANSNDRLPQTYAQKINFIPTLFDVPVVQAQEVNKWVEERARLSAEINKLSAVQMVYAGSFEQPGPTRRNHRGDPTQPREEIQPGALSRIGPPLSLPANAPEQQRRIALAEWLSSPANPLPARVIANRLWHYHFGTGLVETPSDFGINGGRPTHPELLDWLANELVTHQWSLKHLHRLILLSRTYRQSSASNATALSVDSGSRLLWRFPPRRLEAEALRDSILSVTGKLDLTAGGPGFDLFEANDNYVKVYRSKRTFEANDFRRMVYQNKPRMALDDFVGAFDCPDAGQPAPKRTSSTTPLQALSMLNDPFAVQQAAFFSERLEREAGLEAAAQVRRAFQLAFGRDPAPEELSEATALVGAQGLRTLTRALFNANEFIRLN